LRRERLGTFRVISDAWELLSTISVAPLMLLGYPVGAVSLLACPFCRDVFARGEEKRCPHCDIALRPFESLPLSEDARQEGGTYTLPEHETLDVLYLGRGRGVLLGLGLLGLGLFFANWATLTLPFDATFSGMDFAKRMGWPWAALAAWLVLVPTTLSRRSIVQMVRARVPAAFLAAIPAVTMGLLRYFPPKAGYLPIHVTFEWPFWASVATSVAAIIAAFRFGGRIDILQASKESSLSSKGQTLH
jgi:hypothetical protein